VPAYSETDHCVSDCDGGYIAHLLSSRC